MCYLCFYGIKLVNLPPQHIHFKVKDRYSVLENYDLIQIGLQGKTGLREKDTYDFLVTSSQRKDCSREWKTVHSDCWGKLYSQTWTCIVWAVVPEHSLVFEDMVSLEKNSCLGERLMFSAMEQDTKQALVWEGQLPPCLLGALLVLGTKARRWVVTSCKWMVLVLAGWGLQALQRAILVTVISYVLCSIFFHDSLDLVSQALQGLRVCPMLSEEQPRGEQSTAQPWWQQLPWPGHLINRMALLVPGQKSPWNLPGSS